MLYEPTFDGFDSILNLNLKINLKFKMLMLFRLFSNNAGECDQVLFITAKADKQNTKTILYIMFSALFIVI